MEFKISNKAKLVTLVLIVTGALFTGIGAMFLGDHAAQRVLTNGLTNSLFFLFISLGALFFLALQYATETAWYVMVKRIIESVAGYLPVGILFLVVVLAIITLMDGAHIYIWMDQNVVEHDAIIRGKAAYLNKGFFWFRTVAYLLTYYLFYTGFRKRSLEEDKVGGTDIHFKNYKKGALFLVFFAVFSSMQSWDWIMSIDVHWFSTLFGWYVFSGMWVSAMVTIILVTFYLKKLGYLPHVNDSHIHDIGKWVFAISFLWSYLWFSQYMLIWYANMPEEVTYYVARIEDYKILYFGMFFINFAFPMLILMSRDAKRNVGIMTFVGLVIIAGHWMDLYLMVTVGSMGPTSHFGIFEIGMALLMLGVFMRIVLINLTKAPVSPLNHPYLDESIHHEI
ncbi:MAG: quinol:cytochrome C oxidoreductase [Crocinitomicaceae bacterium]|nr:quinol:cytochrome C oxidoreductase [Crocinitomicaceae bacterium]